MKKTELPEGSEILEVKKGDTIIVRIKNAIPAEAVKAFENAVKEKLPASIREDVGVVVVDQNAEFFVKKAEKNEIL